MLASAQTAGLARKIMQNGQMVGDDMDQQLYRYP